MISSFLPPFQPHIPLKIPSISFYPLLSRIVQISLHLTNPWQPNKSIGDAQHCVSLIILGRPWNVPLTLVQSRLIPWVPLHSASQAWLTSASSGMFKLHPRQAESKALREIPGCSWFWDKERDIKDFDPSRGMCFFLVLLPLFFSHVLFTWSHSNCPFTLRVSPFLKVIRITLCLDFEV